MSTYLQEFKRALIRSEKLGLQVPEYYHEPTTPRWLNAKTNDEFAHVVRDALGEVDFSDVNAQCLAFHHRLVPVVSQWLGCEVFYTMGWVDFGAGGSLFQCDEASLAETLRKGQDGNTANIHAWLTLPSMEILDATLSTTLARSNNSAEMLFRAITRHADELNGLTYKPMIVGDDFLRRTGMLRQVLL